MIKLSKEKYFGTGSVPIGVGAVLNGWNITEEHYRNSNFMPVVDFRAMTGACPHNCFHCFTNKQKKTLTLKEIKKIIDQLAKLNTFAIDYLGEGEPTLDKDFFAILNYTKKKGIQPVVFTDAATKLTNKTFVKKLYKTGASVIPKCDSLFNSNFQNWVVADKTNTFFDKRNDALKVLIKEGFNKVQKDGTTRLGFDMVVCKKNQNEVEKTLRFCRENNLWVVFAFYLPSGRCASKSFDKSLMLTKKEKQKLSKLIKKIDLEYGFNHETHNNFITSRCIEFMCIYGDGRVSPCPGSEVIVGNTKQNTIKELKEKILKKYPCHNQKTFDGDCCYRERL